ncbi:MAG: AAA family ATPase [Bacteroidales bacterium]|nr:AAA family ATPase [Bacteroidales bacterium]
MTKPDEFFTDIVCEEQKPQSDNESTLQSVKIDFTKELQPPAWCLKISDSIISTLGNFSLVIGKAKSRKTFFITMVITAIIKDNSEIITGFLPPEKSVILYFDTEQGEYHVLIVAKRICSLTRSHPNNLIIYHLRKFTPSERLELIEYAINNTANVGFVIIDGIKDLATSINDEEQATTIASKLLKWSEEKQIHIICVLHQNKSDNNARGHLGTELINKAETTLSITKDSNNTDFSIVEAEYCRDKEFKKFAFVIDNEGLPRTVENFVSKKEGATKAITVNTIQDNVHKIILNEVFEIEKNQKYNDLMENIILKFGKNGFEFGKSKCRTFIQYYNNEGFIKKQGADKSRDAYYTLNKNDKQQEIF